MKDSLPEEMIRQLRAAKQTIKRYGWLQHESGNKERGFGLVGALERNGFDSLTESLLLSCVLDDYTKGRKYKERLKAHRRNPNRRPHPFSLLKHNFLVKAAAAGKRPLDWWNDVKGRTKKQVLCLIDRAILEAWPWSTD